MCETEFCTTKSILFCDPCVHTGTILLVKPKAKPTILQKRIYVVNYVVNYGVNKFTCLTNQEYLQHAWDITFQQSG